MKINGAIAHAREVEEKYMCNADYMECGKEHKQLADWLEELQQYREIGTVKECCTAAEKQIPFRPDQENLIAGIGRCKCGAEFLDKSTNYCGNCGQKLDWGM